MQGVKRVPAKLIFTIRKGLWLIFRVKLLQVVASPLRDGELRSCSDIQGGRLPLEVLPVPYIVIVVVSVGFTICIHC